jgi:hypothetical protein
LTDPEDGAQHSPPKRRHIFTSEHSGFVGLEAACWPLVPKFAGSHPAEAVGILGQKKILSMPSFGGKV